jgi:hypothetical protein
MFDLTVHEFGRYRYHEMLKEAEFERRCAQARRREGITRVQQRLLQLSRLLTAVGVWLKQRAEAHPSWHDTHRAGIS